MEEKELEQIKELVNLFVRRDDLVQEMTEKILDTVGETVLEALLALFEVPVENVTWMETQCWEDIMLIVASIEYERSRPVPPLIQSLSPAIEDGRSTIRLFRVGLPLNMVFKPKEEILEYLKKTASGSLQSEEANETEELPDADAQLNKDNVSIFSKKDLEFDTSELTEEQRQNLIMFDTSEKKGNKH